jgi:hypothetical protein
MLAAGSGKSRPAGFVREPNQSSSFRQQIAASAGRLQSAHNRTALGAIRIGPRKGMSDPAH